MLVGGHKASEGAGLVRREASARLLLTARHEDIIMPSRPQVHRPAGSQACRQARQAQARQADSSRRNTTPTRRLRDRRCYRDTFVPYRLSLDPICEDCHKAASTEVHHVGKVSMQNLCSVEDTLALCSSCHSRRTGRGE